MSRCSTWNKRSPIQERTNSCSRPDSGKAENHREQDVRAGDSNLAVFHQAERLKAERRERGVTSQKTDHQELLHGRRYLELAVPECERRGQPDQEAAGYIRDKGPNRDLVSESLCHLDRNPIPADTSHSAAGADNQIRFQDCNHGAMDLRFQIWNKGRV